MWIVRLALRRPYTFVVMAVLILVLGIVSILTMSTDIFPVIDIPVVTVIWSYSGTSPDEMEKRFTTVSERAMTTDGQRYRAYRIAVGERHLDHQGLLPAGREDRGCGGAGDSGEPDDSAHPAAGDDASVHSAVQRIECADSAGGAVERQALGVRPVRPGSELCADPAGDRAGRAGAVAVRRQGAAGAWSTSTSASCTRRGFRRPMWCRR